MTLQTKSLKLTAEATREVVVERLKTHFNFQADGYVCTTDMVVDVLLKAATTQQTVEAVCHDLDDMVDGETVRGYLNEQLDKDKCQQLEHQVNQSLVVGLPRRLWKSRLEIAIDLHDESFYGHAPDLSAWACRGEAKQGTTRFFRVATAYVIFKEMRLTLALLFVRPEDQLPEIVAALLRRLRILGVKVRLLYFDKGFCSIPVLRYVAQSGWAAILACPIRGKKGGTRVLCQGRGSYLTEHTFKSQENGAYTAPLVVTRTYTTHRRSKRKQHRVQWLVFVTLNCQLQPHTVRKLYRRRFGIETSYRCMRQVRAWTTSRNPALRFFLISLGFILVNVWAELRWRFCQVKRQGRRQIDTKRFELHRLSAFINRAIEKIYGVVAFIVADVQPLGV